MSYFAVVSIVTSVFSTFLDLVIGRVEWPTCHVGGHGPQIPMSDLFVFGPHIHARSNVTLRRNATSLILDKKEKKRGRLFRVHTSYLVPRRYQVPNLKQYIVLLYKFYRQNQFYPQIQVHRRPAKHAKITFCRLEEF